MNQIIDTAAPVIVTIVLGILLKAVHAAISALAAHLESKTSDAKRKAAIEHIAAIAQNTVSALGAAEKPALIAAAGGLVNGKMPSSVATDLKARAMQAVYAQAPAALSTLQEVEGLSEQAINQLVSHAIEAANAK
jgi:hypothetical protein